MRKEDPTGAVGSVNSRAFDPFDPCASSVLTGRLAAVVVSRATSGGRPFRRTPEARASRASERTRRSVRRQTEKRGPLLASRREAGVCSLVWFDGVRVTSFAPRAGIERVYDVDETRDTDDRRTRGDERLNDGSDGVDRTRRGLPSPRRAHRAGLPAGGRARVVGPVHIPRQPRPVGKPARDVGGPARSARDGARQLTRAQRGAEPPRGAARRPRRAEGSGAARLPREPAQGDSQIRRRVRLARGALSRPEPDNQRPRVRRRGKCPARSFLLSFVESFFGESALDGFGAAAGR